MPIRLTELLKQVPRETESRIRKTREATRNIIQELLRSECRLQLKVGQPEGSKDPPAMVISFPHQTQPHYFYHLDRLCPRAPATLNPKNDNSFRPHSKPR